TRRLVALLRVVSCGFVVTVCLLSAASAQRRKTSTHRAVPTRSTPPAPRATPAATTATPIASQTLNVHTEPNAAVWLDEVRRGTTDAAGQLEIKKISAGRHTLRVRALGFAERV